MKKLNRFILSSLMLGFSLITLASTTYAFVILQREAEVDEFDFDIQSEAGLLISLDGKNFSQDLSLEDVQKQILKNTGNEGKAWEEANIRYDGVTLNSQDNKIIYDEAGNPEFIKDSLVATEDSDYLKHTMVAATSSDYLKLDLYFKLVEQGNITDSFKLRFKNTSISNKALNEPQVVIVENTFSYKDLSTGDDINLAPGDSIAINPVAAMRLGIKNHNADTLKIYEPSLGLGSAAIEGSTIPKHNKEYNPMYQYYNAIHPLSKLEYGAKANEGFDTISSINEDIIGSFNHTDSGYESIHTTVFVFLEGWDADFLLGIPVEARGFKVKLGFEIVK